MFSWMPAKSAHRRGWVACQSLQCYTEELELGYTFVFQMFLLWLFFVLWKAWQRIVRMHLAVYKYGYLKIVKPPFYG